MSQYSQHDGINDMATAYQTDRPELSGTPAPAVYQEAPQSLVSSDPVQQLLVNLDLWTGTVTDKSGGRGRTTQKGGAGKTELTGIKKLRELILELAVRGKLVPQNPNDEHASALLKRIEAEKARLVKDGKIKKPAKLPPVSDDEQPFQLPEGWEWVRLGNLITKLGSGSTPRGGKSAYVDSGIPFLRSQNVWNDGLDTSDIAYISKETHEKMDNTVVYPGDVLLNITGASLGRSTVFPDTYPEANVSQHVTIIRLVEPQMILFIHLCIQAPLVQKLVWGRQVGMAIEGLSKKVLELFEMPLPPLAEQQRIVERVDQLMALCDQLEQGCLQQLDNHQQLVDTLLAELTATSPSPASDSSTQGLSDSTIAAATTGPDAPEHNSAWQRIHDQFDRLFSGAIQTTLRQAQGDRELTVQAENGRLGPAQQAQPTTDAHLIGTGNSDWAIDRLKDTILQLAFNGKLSPHQKHFVALEKLLVFGPKNGFSPKPVEHETSKKVLKLGATSFGELDLSETKFISENTAIDEHLPLKDGDILLQRGNTAIYVGSNVLVNRDEPNVIYPDLMMKIRVSSDWLPEYVSMMLSTRPCREHMWNQMTGTSGTMPKISKKVVQSVPIPVATLAEQQRIVERVDQLFALCDQLKAKQQAASQTRQQLTEALVEQVLG